MTLFHSSTTQKKASLATRWLYRALPAAWRAALYRRMIECDPEPDLRLEVKLAETREELEACYRLLHDSYVAAGFMKTHPSGLRLTPYNALPTTTTLCAKFSGRVVGTLTMVRDGVFGFPMQSAFDLQPVRAVGGAIAEISGLAVHPDFRDTQGAILFPMMKFVHEYCTEYSDTRHLVIAAHPQQIGLYEALLQFRRLRGKPVKHYEFANGAPAVAATLDLAQASVSLRALYQGRPMRSNLHKYFFSLKLEALKLPKRRYFTTNDPVMTPLLLDYFFNKRTQLLAELDDRRKSLLWAIYSMVEYRGVLPMLEGTPTGDHPLRRHQRFAIKAPSVVQFHLPGGGVASYVLSVIEMSISGFQAESKLDLPIGVSGAATVELGKSEESRVSVTAVRRKETDAGLFFGFKLDGEPDRIWRQCVAALEMGQTSHDLI